MKESLFQNNYDIFRFLPSNLNDKFKTMSLNDKRDLIKYLSNYYLELRNNLNLEKTIRFGFEFEFEDAYGSKIKKDLYNKGFDDKWNLKDDDSLFDGYEIASPILRDSKNDWNKVESLCETLRNYSKIGQNAGAHIHIGADVIRNKKETLSNLVLFWIAYENIIYRFGYGNFLNNRNNINLYAKPIAGDWYKDYFLFQQLDNKPIQEFINWFSNFNKNSAINLNNIKSFKEFLYNNTIEFRNPNGTLDPVIWQNNLNLFSKIITYCFSCDFDREFIKNRICENYNKFKIFGKLSNYRKLYIDQAMELCDLLFKNNEDKIYFLRQYIKDGNVYNGNQLFFSKPFTKTRYSKF